MTADPRRWLILATVTLSFLPVTLDSTVLYLAIPALTLDLGASATEILWIMDIYPLTMAGLVLISGPMGDRFGQRNLLLTGLLLFGAASGFAAFAPTPALLIAARIALALGGCMIIPSTLALVRRIFTDPRERGIAIGVWSAVASAGSALGPVVGGLLLEHFWWGAAFLVNVPITLVAIAVIAPMVRNEPQPESVPLQPATALAGILGLIGVVYAIKEIARGGGDPAITGAAGALGIVLLGVFVGRQLKAPAPMLDLRLFRLRRFSIGVLMAMGPVMVLIGFALAIVQQMQFVEGLSPLAAGLVIVPLDIAAAVAGPASGYLLTRLGLRALGVGALMLAGLGYALLLGFGMAGVGAAMVLLGFGHGAAMSMATTSMMSSAPADRAGAAAAIESVSYEVGTGLGVAIFGSVLGVAYLMAYQGPAEFGASIGATLSAAEVLGGTAGEALAGAGRAAFSEAFRSALWLALGTIVFVTLVVLRHGPRVAVDSPTIALGKRGP